MNEVQVKAWPLAIAGSLLVHVTAVTGLYLIPTPGQGHTSTSAVAAFGPPHDAAPLYLIPDELPPDVAARLEADRAAHAHDTPPPAQTRAEAPPASQRPIVQKPPPPLDPVIVPLGTLDGAPIRTEAWLKSDAPGEHQAMLSKVTQPQQDLKAEAAPQGLPGQAGANGRDASAKNGKPTETAAQASQKPGDRARIESRPRPDGVDAPPTMQTVAPQPGAQVNQPNPPDTLQARPVAPEPVAARPNIDAPTPAGNSGGARPDHQATVTLPASPAVELVGPPLPEHFVRPPQEPTGAPQARGGAPGAPGAQVQAAPGGAAPGAPGVPSARPTVKSDRDSDASSTRISGVFRNGKVEAGEGLDIKTVRPEFGLTTRALLQPRSPTLEVVFGKDGRARSVRVLKSSGYPSEVDEPVVNALYAWRARGKALDQLPPREDASVSLEITILLQ